MANLSPKLSLAKSSRQELQQDLSAVLRINGFNLASGGYLMGQDSVSNLCGVAGLCSANRRCFVLVALHFHETGQL